MNPFVLLLASLLPFAALHAVESPLNVLLITADDLGHEAMDFLDGKVPGATPNLSKLADKQWHWADAEIAGNKVIVSSKVVPTPVAVRYAWAMNPSQRNLLYNKEGLPASPFRTDTWPLFDPNNPDVGVEKPEMTEEARDAKTNYQDWERPQMTQ